MKSLSVLLLLGWLGGCCLAAPQEWTRHTAEQTHMGTVFRVVCYVQDPVQAESAIDAAFARIAALDQMMSDYLPDSELNRLSATAGGPAQPVSADLWQVLAAAVQYAEATAGAFDPTLGPSTRLWRRSRRQQQLPTPDQLAVARAAIGWQHLQLEAESRRIRLLRPGMRLDLGGIAKGYALDQALKTLTDAGCPRALVDGGGDLALGDPPPGRSGWTVALQAAFPDTAPPPALHLAHCGVATSGDLYQRVEIDGQSYSHLIDPTTGLGLTTRIAATVIAPTATAADALASAACVRGRDGVSDWPQRFLGVRVLLRGLSANGSPWSEAWPTASRTPASR